MNRHKLLTGFSLLIFCLMLLSGCGKIAVPSDSIVIQNGTVIDGIGGEPIPGGLVVVKEGKIWAVGKKSKFKIPSGVKVFDAKQGYILPGLIDTHVHVSNSKSMKTWMMAGVTTVRDLGGPRGIMLARKWTREADEPRLLISGPILTVPGGYPIPAWGDKVAQPVTNPRDAERVVEDLVEDGVDVIKIAITEGMDKKWPTLSMEEIRAITSTAHKHGIKVVAHVLRAQDARRAVEGGVDQLGHDVVDELPQELIMNMVNKHVIMIPTLNVLTQGIENDLQLTVEQRTQARENLLQNVKRFVAIGGTVALGDDFGVVGVNMDIPFNELLLMHEAGLTTSQVISAATANAALALGKEKDIGILAKDKEADILVVKKDPLTDLKNLATTKGVFFKGEAMYWDN